MLRGFVQQSLCATLKDVVLSLPYFQDLDVFLNSVEGCEGLPKTWESQTFREMSSTMDLQCLKSYSDTWLFATLGQGTHSPAGTKSFPSPSLDTSACEPNILAHADPWTHWPLPSLTLPKPHYVLNLRHPFSTCSSGWLLC